MEYTSEQLWAITSLKKRVCVDAGAGSGKTRVLIDRIVYLIEAREADLEEVVAITFTDKAAGEMKARLRQAFRDKATPEDDPDTASRWRDLERRVESARISTIHSFCTALLREHALGHGMDPDFALLDEAERALLLNRVVTETFLGLLDAGDDAAMLLGEEFGARAVVATLKGMVRRQGVVERAQAPHWSGDADVLLAHWREAFEAEEERWLEGLRTAPEAADFARALRGFEGACTKEGDGRENLRTAQIKALETLMSDAPAQSVREAVQRALATKASPHRKANWVSTETAEALAEAEEAVKKWLLKHFEKEEETEAYTARSAALTAAVCRVGRAVFNAWATAKGEANSFDFDDLIDRARRALLEDEALCRRVAGGIRFLLMDEFQDTDANQLAIARALCEAHGGPSLFIVGDAKQSIYYFRGAEVEVFAEEREAARAEGEVIPLGTNFRSLPDVLDFVNDFFARSEALCDVEQPFTPLGTHRDAAGGTRVEFLIPEAPEEGKLNAEDGRRAEADLLAARIAALCADSAPPCVWDEAAGGFRRADYGDAAILLRSMSNVHLYEAALRARGIPYTLVAGAGFYTCREVMDVTSLLHFVVDPSDVQALAAFLRGPLAGISDEDLLRLGARGRLLPAFAAAETPEGFGDAAALDRARALVAELCGCVELPPAAFLRRLLDRTGFEAVLRGQFLGVQKVANIRKLVEQAEAFGAGRTPSLRAFARYIDEVRAHDLREGEALLQAEGAVAIMTIHRAKGLEFPVVFVADASSEYGGSNADALYMHRDLGLAMKCAADDGEWSTPPMGRAIRKRIAAEEGAEHARLLYVALTRARDFLVVSGSPGAKEKTWLGMLDAVYDLDEREDGAAITGQGWCAAVRRTVDEAPAQRAGAGPRVEVPDTLPGRLYPPDLAPAPVRTWSVSALLDHLADGHEEEEERPRDAEAEEALGRARDYAMARGTMVHRLFELWDFHSNPEPLLPGLVAEAGVPVGKREDALTQLRGIAAYFAGTDLGTRMAAEGGVRREAPFLLNLGEALVSGVIDAILSDGTLIDYKTGQRREACHERYAWQLRLYAAAMDALGEPYPATGWLCYVDVPDLCPVDLSGPKVAEALARAKEAVAEMAELEQRV